MSQYETFQNKVGSWKWRLKNGDGKVVAEGSVAFKYQADAERAAAEVVNTAKEALDAK